jgi:integrase
MRDTYQLVCYRGVWCVYWRENGRPRRNSLHTRDRAQAEREYAAVLAKLQQPARPKLVTVSDCLAAYYEAKPQVIPRPKLGQFFGQMLPDAIDQATCEAYPKQRKAAVKTIHTEMGILRSALIHAQRLKWITAPFIWMPPNGDPRDRWLSHEEAARLVDACDQPHLKLFIHLGLHTVARPGTILDLTWDQILWGRGMINLNPAGRARTHKGRPLVKMTPELHGALKAAQEAALSGTTHVISWGRRRVKSVKRAFKEACARAGLDDVTPNTLRHTGATWMAGAGVPMRQISGMMGHSSVEVTERVYAKHHPDYQKEATAALAQFSFVQVNTPAVNKAATGSRNARNRSAKDHK